MPKHPVRDIVLAASLTLSIAACATPDGTQSWDDGAGALYNDGAATGVTTYGLPLPELSWDDRDALARIAYAEAGNQGDEGIAAVVYTIFNRVNSGQFQSTVQDVIDAPNQFEPATRVGGWRNLPPLNSARSSQFDTILDLILAGRLPDLTNGALFFQNARIVAARATRGKGSWSLVDFGGTPPVAEIGDHRFYDWRAAINLAAARARSAVDYPAVDDSGSAYASEGSEYAFETESPVIAAETETSTSDAAVSAVAAEYDWETHAAATDDQEEDGGLTATDEDGSSW